MLDQLYVLLRKTIVHRHKQLAEPHKQQRPPPTTLPPPWQDKPTVRNSRPAPARKLLVGVRNPAAVCKIGGILSPYFAVHYQYNTIHQNTTQQKAAPVVARVRNWYALLFESRSIFYFLRVRVSVCVHRLVLLPSLVPGAGGQTGRSTRPPATLDIPRV